ncbi:hypothetical protein F5Y12DRAFT_582827 [Xylaria sp. FL1777]|nr:hypothetical protein F5Y12DRAFT_582827 [Xylaria sp. FL1777]
MPRRMDYEASQRIARARGRNDSFSKRAAMTSRNQCNGGDGGQEKPSEEPKAGKDKEEEHSEKSKSGNDGNS